MIPHTVLRPDRVLHCSWRAREPALLACGLNLIGRSAYRNAVGTLVAAAGLAAETDQPWISYSRSKNWYAAREANGDLTYDNVVAGMAQGVEAGLFDEDRARQGAHLDEVPRQSRYRATPLLIERLGDASFEHLRPSSSIIMRDEDGKTVAVPDTERARRLRKEADCLNEWLSSMKVEVSPDASPEDWHRARHHLRARKVKDGRETWACALPTPTPEIVRIFGRGRFDCHGRLYGWWQSLPKERRAELLINGEFTVEPDFAMLHPTLLYAAVGATMPRDVYDTGEHDRAHGKLALNIGMNTKGGLKGAVDALMWRDGWTGTRAYTQGLVDAIADLNKPIAQFIGSDVGVRLMGIDSGMAVEVMKRCRKEGIPVLPVHDSFRVAAKSENHVTAIMADALDAARVRINHHISKGKAQIVLQEPRAVGAAAETASPPPASSAPSLPVRPVLRPSWDLAERTAAMIVYQRRQVSADRLERAPGAPWVDWEDRMIQAEAHARYLARFEFETGIRTFPTSIVPDRLPAKPKDRLASHKGKAKPRIPSPWGKGRRPQVNPSHGVGA